MRYLTLVVLCLAQLGAPASAAGAPSRTSAEPAAATRTGAARAGNAVVTIAGQVRDRTSQAPIAGAEVSFYTPGIFQFPDFVGRTTTDAEGRYRIVPNFGSAFYGVAAAAGHAARASDDSRCESHAECLSYDSRITPDAAGNVVADFALSPGAVVSGRVFDRDDQSRPYYVSGNLEPVDPADFRLRRSIAVDADGNFRVGELHAGAYRLSFGATQGGDRNLPYLRYYWPDLHCNDVQVLCASLPVTPIVLGEAAQIADLAIGVRRGSQLRARLRSSGNGQYVSQYTRVSLPGQPGRYREATSFFPDNFAVVAPLLPGSVNVALYPDAASSYNAVVYPDRACNGWSCDFGGAATVEIPAEDGIHTLPDVPIAPLRTIRGRVVSADGQPLAGVRVAAGNLRAPPVSGFDEHGSVLSDANGDYQLEAFYSASVVVRTRQDAMGWLDQAWQYIECTDGNLFCELQSDYPRIRFDTQAHHAGIDFRLSRAHGGTLLGRVAETTTLTPQPDYVVFVIPMNTPRRGKFVRSDTEGRFRIDDLPAGAYYLLAHPRAYDTGAITGIFYPSNQPCGFTAEGWTTCLPTTVEPLTVSDGSVLSDLTILIPRPDPIFSDGFR
ncbi:carboxypeptidase-like regulatory domain-containing protein [Tahibacter caeni]|uniref:carboxypeptidase-like regulatory domain-containing protein n=1 Tax=Tahibacter caeni TaxID=1453545 RepID=UPI002147599A|nr:carboxypeptidase-like regulatory domain-containing protein [Tahibacter caeni]